MNLEQYLKNHKETNIWKIFLFFSSIFVIFLTIYLLTKPAITMKGELICGLEHEHVESCYAEVVDEVTYICGLDTHLHGNECYSETGDLICLQIEHTHVGECLPLTVSSGDSIMMFSTASVQSKGRISFENWINNISIHFKEGDNWQEVQNNQIKQNDKLKFTIHYDVPPYTLDYTNRTIEYQIPNNITILQEANGNVYNDNGEAIGTYLISTNGNIAITFNDSFVEKNMNGQIITGNIAFESDVNNIANNNASSTTIKFNSQVTIVLDIVDKIGNTPDLQVEKTTTNVNTDNGTVQYIITVTSQNGTSGNILLNDNALNGIEYAGNFKVVDGNGNQVNVNAPNVGSTNFDLNLPQLSSNGKYIITYDAKLNSSITSSVDVINNVEVTSSDNNGLNLKDNNSVTTKFSQNYIQKSANASQTEDIINWTININQDKQDISGFVLSDLLNRENFSGPVTITNSSGQSQTINLPYTFQGNDSYIITYTTTKDRLIGETNVLNIAILTSPNGKEYKSEQNVYIPGGNYNPVKKNGINGVYDAENKRVELNWNLTLSSNSGELSAPFMFRDTLQQSQYFTKSQLLDIVNQLNSWGISYTMLVDNAHNVDSLQDNQKYKSFEITINSNIAKGNNYNLNYYSYNDLEKFDTAITYTNEINYNNQDYSYTNLKVGPVVKKVDLTTDSTDNSEVDYYDINGELSWGIYVNLPESLNGIVTIEEVLPEGVDITDIKVKVHSTMHEQTFTQNGNVWTMTNNNNTITATLENNILKIIIPESLNNSNEITFSIYTKIKDDFNWDNTTIAFKNTIIAKDNTGTNIGSSSHTFDVTKDDSVKILNKTTNINPELPNIIPYSIEINPNGDNLVENSDSINLVDNLTYTGSKDSVLINLIPSSVKVYRKDGEGNLIELSSNDFTYTYSENIASSYGPCENLLSFTVPDSMPLIVEYKYKVNGAIGTVVRDIINTISALDIPNSPGESSTSASITISSSSASATVKGVTIIKRDSNNNALLLEGVEFQLYEWNGNEYVLYTDSYGINTFSTKTNGEINFAELIPNKAYKLVETKPLLGYKDIEPIYFIISNSDTETYPELKPDNFNGTNVVDNMPIVINNEKPTTSISTEKIWLDANGNLLNEHPASVDIHLYRYAVPINILDINYNNKYTFVFKMGVNESTIWNRENFTYNGGNKLRLIVTFDGPNWGYEPPIVKYGDKILTNLTTNDNDPYTMDTYTYEFSVNESTELTVYTNEWDGSKWNYSLDVISTGFPEDIDLNQYVETTAYDSISLGLSNDWKYVWNNLPTLGEKNNEKVTYIYFVTESEVYGYKTEIETDGNNFIIKNKKQGVKPTYILPQTGGIGTKLYFSLIFIFITIIIGILYFKNKE